jgi:hypothetical protein
MKNLNLIHQNTQTLQIKKDTVLDLPVTLISAPLPPDVPTLKIDNILATENTQVSIPVRVKHMNDISSISLTIDFDQSKLQYVNYKNVHASLLNSFLLITNYQNQVIMSWFSIEPLNIEDDILFEIIFEYTHGDANLTWNPTFGLCMLGNHKGEPLLVRYANGNASTTIKPPVVLKDVLDISAISMIAQYTSRLINIESITINGSGQLAYTAKNDILNIQWMTMTPSTLELGDILLVIKAKALVNFTKSDEIVFELIHPATNDLNELGNYHAQAIPNVVISVDNIKSKTIKLPTSKVALKFYNTYSNAAVFDDGIKTSYVYALKKATYTSTLYLQTKNLIIDVTTKSSYKSNSSRFEAKKQAWLAKGYHYILIIDANYQEFINTYL